ncbi:hypothetical protein BGZ52_004944 [Haplosporangium bisporale]|nr:hypothetical protein BGZ52_004944 [Haplosporangium bisporale]
MEPEVSEDPNSDVILPVTYRVEGETQYTRIVIPREASMTRHPAYAVAVGIAQGQKPERTSYRVDGVITIKVYRRKEDGNSALSSRLRLSAPMVECEEEEDLPDLSFLKVRTYGKESKKRGAKEVAQELVSKMQKHTGKIVARSGGRSKAESSTSASQEVIQLGDSEDELHMERMEIEEEEEEEPLERKKWKGKQKEESMMGHLKNVFVSLSRSGSASKEKEQELSGKQDQVGMLEELEMSLGKPASREMEGIVDETESSKKSEKKKSKEKKKRGPGRPRKSGQEQSDLQEQ